MYSLIFCLPFLFFHDFIVKYSRPIMKVSTDLPPNLLLHIVGNSLQGLLLITLLG